MKKQITHKERVLQVAQAFREMETLFEVSDTRCMTITSVSRDYVQYITYPFGYGPDCRERRMRCCSPLLFRCL
jgi:hypothetical protein